MFKESSTENLEQHICRRHLQNEVTQIHNLWWCSSIGFINSFSWTSILYLTYVAQHSEEFFPRYWQIIDDGLTVKWQGKSLFSPEYLARSFLKSITEVQGTYYYWFIGFLVFRYVVLSFEDFGISDIHDFFLGPLGHFIWDQRRFIEKIFLFGHFSTQ